MTIFSPQIVGKTETRKSISRPLPSLSLMRPSCGRRRSAMSSDAMILMRLVMRVLQLERRRHLLGEHAVDAVAHAELLLVRLDVDVARALLDGVEEDHVDEADDRRVLAGLLELEEVDVLLVAA